MAKVVLTAEQIKLLEKINGTLQLLLYNFERSPKSTRYFMEKSHLISNYSYRNLSDISWLKYWKDDILPQLMDGSRHYTGDVWNTAMIMKSVNLLWNAYKHDK